MDGPVKFVITEFDYNLLKWSLGKYFNIMAALKSLINSNGEPSIFAT